MQIKINKKSYNIKYTVRALFIFEQITEKNFELKTMLDQYLFFYSIILANNPDNVLSWDDFIKAVDNDATLMTKFLEYLTEFQKSREVFEKEDKETGEKKN